MRVFLFLIILGIVSAPIGSYLWLHNIYTKPSSVEEQIIYIQPGWGVSKIADFLQAQGVVQSPLPVKIAARLWHDHTKMQAGEYEIGPFDNLEHILTRIEQGQVYLRSFTIPEGLTSHQIVKRLEAVEKLEGEITPLPAEGSLLPETYFYKRGDSRAEKIERMQVAMSETLDRLWEARQPNLPLNNKYEALTLASIVEKETSVAAEREKVAGVFINRLRKGMKLQTDPTVIYAMTGGDIEEDGQGPIGRRLLRKDLQIDSPYNTYRYAGLPPGPIANPGAAAIAATLNPEAHDYLYFVADGSGGHAFGKTLAEHNRNVANWRRVRDAK